MQRNKAAAIARLAAAKRTGGGMKRDAPEAASLYEELDEAEYAKRVVSARAAPRCWPLRRRLRLCRAAPRARASRPPAVSRPAPSHLPARKAARRAEGDFVVDDNGLGYADDGEEHGGDEEEEEEEEEDEEGGPSAASEDDAGLGDGAPPSSSSAAARPEAARGHGIKSAVGAGLAGMLGGGRRTATSVDIGAGGARSSGARARMRARAAVFASELRARANPIPLPLPRAQRRWPAALTTC